MPIDNYAKEYGMFRLLIGIKSPFQPPLMSAGRVQVDNFVFRVLGRQFGKIYFGINSLVGVFFGKTRKKSAGVYKGILMVYFRGYMYCTNNMFTVLFF